MITVEKTYEDEKQLLLKQIQQSSEQIQQLEKDLYFYKHKTRELRKSMATSVTNLHQDDRRNSKTDNHQQTPFILKIGNRSNSAHQS